MQARGYKRNLIRFYGLVVEGEKALKQYTMRGYMMLHVVVESAYPFVAPKVKFRTGPQKSTSTSTIGPDDVAPRDMCGNAYSIAAMMYADVSSGMKLGIVVVVAGRHNKLSNSVPWLLTQRRGGFAGTMQAIVNELFSEEAVQDIGFILPCSSSKRAWEPGEV